MMGLAPILMWLSGACLGCAFAMWMGELGGSLDIIGLTFASVILSMAAYPRMKS